MKTPKTQTEPNDSENLSEAEIAAHMEEWINRTFPAGLEPAVRERLLRAGTGALDTEEGRDEYQSALFAATHS